MRTVNEKRDISRNVRNVACIVGIKWDVYDQFASLRSTRVKSVFLLAGHVQ